MSKSTGKTDQSRIKLLKQAFTDSDWFIDLSDQNHADYYHAICKSFQPYIDGKNNVDEYTKKLFIILNCVCSMRLVPSDVKNPLQPLATFSSGETTCVPADITEQDQSLFAIMLDDIKEPILKARIAHLLWILKRDNVYAEKAIDAYTRYELTAENFIRGHNGACWEMAARLSLQLKDSLRLKRIKIELLALLDGNTDLHIKFFKMLDDLKLDKGREADIADKLFDQGSKERLSLIVRDMFKFAKKKYIQCNNLENAASCQIKIAESFELDAERNASHLCKNSHYGNALLAYENVPKKYRNPEIKQKISQLKQKKIDSGIKAIEMEMISCSTTSDISPLKDLAIKHVSNKSTLIDAIVSLVRLYPFLNEATCQNKNSDQGFLSGLGDSAVFAKDGRTINKNSNPIKIENILIAQSDPVIRAAVNKIIKDHGSVPWDFLYQEVSTSPITPYGHAILITHALWFGFEGKFDVAIHLICPQVEAIVRNELKKCSVEVTHTDKEGIDDFVSLNTLIDKSEFDQLELLGDTKFEIKTLFTDKSSGNLRNEVAHGILDDNSSIDSYSIYAWYFLLKLIFLSHYNHQLQGCEADKSL